MATGAVVLNLC